MFTSFLAGLQALVSSRFTVASFFPTLAFLSAHVLMACGLNAPFRSYVTGLFNQSTGVSAAILASVLVATAMFAYALSAVLPAAQSLMEGNWGRLLVAWFTPPQAAALEQLEAEMLESRRLIGSISGPDGSGVQKRTWAEAWQEDLTTARVQGAKVTSNTYTRSCDSAKLVATLSELRRRSRAISAAELTRAVALLVVDLRKNNSDIAGTDANLLENTREALWNLIDYARDYARSEYRRLMTRRTFLYGAFPLSPTRMGNVAQTIQAYSVDRYEFNFQIFWSRLQISVQQDKEFAPVLEAAKTQLDFLIACSCLTFAWSVLWLGWLLGTHGPWPVTLGAALGPALAWVWYRAAVVRYQTFADLLRSAVDLFRFNLLERLHLPRPDGLVAERDLWESLDAMQVFSEVRDIRHVHPKAT